MARTQGVQTQLMLFEEGIFVVLEGFFCTASICFIFHSLLVTALVMNYRIWHTWLVTITRYVSQRFLTGRYIRKTIITYVPSVNQNYQARVKTAFTFSRKMPHYLKCVTISWNCVTNVCKNKVLHEYLSFENVQINLAYKIKIIARPPQTSYWCNCKQNHWISSF